MSHTERGLFVALIVSVTLVLHGCAGADRADPEYESSDTFPMPAGREDAVSFWRNVYAPITTVSAAWGRPRPGTATTLLASLPTTTRASAF
jgi:hypothetical protein